LIGTLLTLTHALRIIMNAVAAGLPGKLLSRVLVEYPLFSVAVVPVAKGSQNINTKD